MSAPVPFYGDRGHLRADDRSIYSDDGFSNVFYPTNPALLISLGLANVGYGSWFSWSIRFQLMNLLLTAVLLLFGLAVGY